jgi:RimJ/RimL family protein N-acetyltransferase
MNSTHVTTKNLKLVLRTRDEVRADVEQMPPHERAEVSPVWLALLDSSNVIDPWIHGFVLVHGATGSVVGQGGFKGPPEADGSVEVAYGVAPGHEGKGYATEAAAALVDHAFGQAGVRVVRACKISRHPAPAL